MGIRGIPFEVVIVDDVPFDSDLPLEDRITLKLVRFRGQRLTEATKSQIMAMLHGELARSEASGEIESAADLEVNILDIYGSGNINVEVRPKQPPAPVLPKVKVPRGPSTPPDDEWEKRMTRYELLWIEDQFKLASKGLYCVDNYRAARVWKSSDKRRYNRIKDYGCCGSQDFIAKRWNQEKGRHDIFLLGFNHGH